MTLGVESPAVLFPALSLLLLAYTNRFLAITKLIRRLHDEYEVKPSSNLIRQILNLRRRIRLIRDMQTLGIVSIFMSVLSIAFIYFGLDGWASIIFGLSLLLMLTSLILSIYEIHISIEAITTELEDIIEDRRGFFNRFGKKTRIIRPHAIRPKEDKD
jgi:hypothetical protein